MCERKPERRPVAARQPRDEVRPLRHAREELGLDAVRREVVAEQLGRARLVAGRVDRVQPDQLPGAARLTSSRSVTGWLLLLRERGQLVPDLPELREEDLVDQPAEHLDRRALRADDASPITRATTL